MKLRPVQQECLDSVLSSFRRGGNFHLAIAPCGFGKTILSSALITESVVKYGVKCLFLAHMTELVLQTEEKLKRVSPDIDCGVWCGKLGRKENRQVTIGSRQSIVRALDKLDDVSLIIIDEVHVWGTGGDYSMIIDHFMSRNKKLRVLGVTGTPYRLGEGYIYGDKKTFPDFVHETTVDEMVEMGYLSPYRYKLAKTPDFSSVKKNAGEYHLGELTEELVRKEHMGSVSQVIEQFASDRKSIMVFAVTIEHAEALADHLGVFAVHSKLKKSEYRQRVDDFKSGKDRIIVNVSQLSIGFDHPDVDCIVLARPTMSTALFVQMCGRSWRLADGKEDSLIIDLVGNYKRHGLPSDPKVKKEKEERDAPKGKGETEGSVCPKCFEVTTAKVCPSCGNRMEEVIQIDEVTVEDVDMSKEKVTINKLWVKENHTTQKGNTGPLFCIKTIEREVPLFHFVSNSAFSCTSKRAKFHNLSVGQKVEIVSGGGGDWVKW